MVSFDFFVEHFLPSLPPHINLDDIYSTLKTDGPTPWRAVTSQGRWRGFAAERTIKGVAFRKVKFIVNAIAKASATTGAPPPLQFCHRSRKSLRTKRDDDSLPDGYLSAQRNSSAKASWLDVAVSGEYRQGMSSYDEEEVSV